MFLEAEHRLSGLLLKLETTNKFKVDFHTFSLKLHLNVFFHTRPKIQGEEE